MQIFAQLILVTYFLYFCYLGWPKSSSMFVYLLILQVKTGKTEIWKINKITKPKWPKYKKTKLRKWHEPNDRERNKLLKKVKSQPTTTLASFYHMVPQEIYSISKSNNLTADKKWKLIASIREMFFVDIVVFFRGWPNKLCHGLF